MSSRRSIASRPIALPQLSRTRSGSKNLPMLPSPICPRQRAACTTFSPRPFATATAWAAVFGARTSVPASSTPARPSRPRSPKPPTGGSASISRSPGFVPGNRTSEHLSFSVPVSITSLLDTTRPPLSRDSRRWVDTVDYSACQALAEAARAAGGQAIRSPSARDPQGINLALFDPACFAKAEPDHGRGWHLRLEGRRLTALAAFPSGEVLEFTAEQFGLTPLG